MSLLKNNFFLLSTKKAQLTNKINANRFRAFTYNRTVKDGTVVKQPIPKDPHTDPHPEKPNELDPKGGLPPKPNTPPTPFPEGPKKPKPTDFPIPDELYPQPI
ncbi:hypothetical protein DICPUDRAFT_76088 [Dictyostelium purpureum]|uniref:Uncharacterized protein n=1 Tax=Dictyostelium purpureum TaxID=5786 RepID=F0ZCJ9_DICPU|nr:uncharacterized protein DICPUDRAFT_76088 [Dictyostelium purpureum]EGC38281.1 hypothetical protein DICPUDRAFT_76088 [Dictyostelium purpureum]|eukprot:XP_003285142.1 hypothetical protein DICPUDRAFT_76088 [Dictyostelium purpureum]